MAGGIIEHVNEKRASCGLDAVGRATRGKGVSLNEPRIQSKTPFWVGCEEISRSDNGVWFKTGLATRSLVQLKDVESFENKNKQIKDK